MITSIVDNLVQELSKARQHADSVKLEKMIEHSRAEKSQTLTWDPTKLDPDKLIGIWIKKTFEDYGEYEGQIVSHDVDEIDNIIYRMNKGLRKFTKKHKFNSGDF